jgi:preprotein translocase subunit SecE
MSDQNKIGSNEANQSNLALVVAIGLILASLIAYYVLATQPLALRLGVLFGGIALAIGITAITPNGKAFISYAKDSVNEIKKVVWPSRKETTQMTLIVFAFVAIMAIFLWSTDKIIEWIIFSVFLGWK